MEKNQFKCHGFAWFETYRISLVHTLNWYKTLSETGKASRLEELILASGFSEYVLQMRDGIMMSQSEVIRPIYNLAGMGLFTTITTLQKDDVTSVPPGYFWCEYLQGKH